MIRFVAVTVLVALTTLGAWLASSLVAWAGGPPELACVGAVLLFPVLPLWWERRATDAFHAQIRRSVRLLPKKRGLTAPIRIALRTVFLNVAFVALLLVLWPKVAFAALATRGDWFLGDAHGVWSDRTRSALITLSSSLEWLHRAANDNPYRTREDEKVPVPKDVKPTEVMVITTKFGSGQRWRRPDPRPVTPDEPKPPIEEQPDAPEPAYTVGATQWPWPTRVHPVVSGMTADDESSPEAVARYIKARIDDPFERVKALHDWEVTRLHYDFDSLKRGQRKPQDAQSVFLGRMGVCEGYARLFVELGRLTGDRIVYVTGDVRDEKGEMMPVGHAWNAVEIRGAWYLVDVTWDDPGSDDRASHYRTDYLFSPADVMGLDHFPDEERWQLRHRPMRRAEFLRQPFVSPGLAREHLTLLSPGRSVVSVTDTFHLELENPAQAWLMLQVDGTECGITNDSVVSLNCPVQAGAKKAQLFINRNDRYGSYDWVVGFTLQ